MFTKILGDNLFPPLFQLPGVVHFPWLMAPSHHAQNQQHGISLPLPRVHLLLTTAGRGSLFLRIPGIGLGPPG